MCDQAQLKSALPTGVCDNKPGKGFRPAAWLRHQDGVGRIA